jgi:hypothetical protein
MYDPALLLFAVGVLTGIAISLLMLSVRHVLAALQHLRRRLSQSR